MSASIRVNGEEEKLVAATIAAFLRARGVEVARGVAVAINGAVVPSRRWRETALVAVDEIEIVRPFGGG